MYPYTFLRRNVPLYMKDLHTLNNQCVVSFFPSFKNPCNQVPGIVSDHHNWISHLKFFFNWIIIAISLDAWLISLSEMIGPRGKCVHKKD